MPQPAAAMPAGSDTASLALPARLGLGEASALRDALLSRRGAALVIDAGAVDHLGTPCLQVLLAATEVWRVDRQHFSIAPVSSGFAGALTCFGLTSDALTVTGEPSGDSDRAGQKREASWD